LQALLCALQKSPAVCSIVRPGNFIDITSSKWSQNNPLKANPQAGDLPELIVLPGRFQWFPHGKNSRAAELYQEFIVGITTDTLRIGGDASTLFAAQVAVLAALSQTPPDLGLSGIVRGFGPAINGDDQGLIEKAAAFLGRDSRRWIAVMNLPVDITLNNQYLATLNQPGQT
jgi:hypothetical protein